MYCTCEVIRSLSAIEHALPSSRRSTGCRRCTSSGRRLRPGASLASGRAGLPSGGMRENTSTRSSGDKTCGYPGGATHQIRAHDQPQNCEGAGPDNLVLGAGASGPRHRMTETELPQSGGRRRCAFRRQRDNTGAGAGATGRRTSRWSGPLARIRSPQPLTAGVRLWQAPVWLLGMGVESDRPGARRVLIKSSRLTLITHNVTIGL